MCQIVPQLYFFQAVAVSVLLYECTNSTLMKRMDKKLDGTYIRMLSAIFDESWKEHPTKQQLCDHLPPISHAILVKHIWALWRSKNELLGKILLWTPTHVHICVSQPAKTYTHQRCVDTGCKSRIPT